MAQQRAADEPRFTRIADGVWAQVEDRSAALPRHLSASAHEGRLIRPCACRPLLESMTSVVVHRVILAGTRLECRDQHDLLPYISGRYGSLDLRLSICRYCGAVEVRDVSFDILVDEDPRGGRRFITPPSRARRRDRVLGFYAGRRVSGRVHL